MLSVRNLPRAYDVRGSPPDGCARPQGSAYRGLRTLEDAAELAGIVLDPAGSDGDRREALGHVEGIFSPTGLLVQALRVCGQRSRRA